MESPSPRARRSPREVLDSLDGAVAPTATSPEGARILLQDWRPLHRSLEWILSRHYWESQGLEPFLRGEVPYVVNNTSWLAESAVEFLIAKWSLADPGPHIRILELGAGLGLFARQVLDGLRDRCLRDGSDYFERVTYYVTDGSARTVARWRDDRLFAGHEPHVVLAVSDALRPLRLDPEGRGSAREELPERALQAIFANYVLDSLPATVLRRAPDRSEGLVEGVPRAGADSQGVLEELRIRTHLALTDAAELDGRFGLSLDQVRAMAARAEGEPRAPAADVSAAEDASVVEARDRLLSLLPYFDFEVGYGPAEGPVPYWATVEPLLARSGRLVSNHGALECLERCLSGLAPGGALLVRDLGPVSIEQLAEISHASRFGSSIAVTLDFPLLEARMADLGCVVCAPPGDDAESVHTRLILPGADPAAAEVFSRIFGERRHSQVQQLSDEAVAHIHAGRYEVALDRYRHALDLCPNDWHLLGHAAQFLTQQLLRPAEALELVERALEINPKYSAFLWNTMGNCHFCLQDPRSAHRAYLVAEEIHPRDAQTQLNLAYTWTAFGRLDEALVALARGLAWDEDERFESALLAKQKEVLAKLQQRRQEADERSRRRQRTFTSDR